MAAPGKNTAVLDSVTAPLRKHLDDPSVTELVINLPGEVGIERRGRWTWESEPSLDFKTLMALATAAAAYTSQDVTRENTRSTILSKGISAGHGQNTYRGLVKIGKKATGARNHTQCDSLLLGSECGAHTFPYIEVMNPTAQVEHEASTSTIGEDQLFYCRQRGIPVEDAASMIVNGFCREVFKELPMEFAVEAQKLLSVSLEGCVG